MPSVLAVLRLITSSYLVAACTGKLAGFSPLRMRSIRLPLPRSTADKQSAARAVA
jgi:hypothetical protein